MIPQLPTEIREDRMLTLIADDQWCMSQKIDGHRLVLGTGGTKLKRYNRHGEETPVPEEVEASKLARISLHMLLDGEFLDGTFWVFDILELKDKSLLKWPWFGRQELLASLIEKLDDPILRLVKQCDLWSVKQDFLDTLKNNNAEGVVFADRNGRYHPNRSPSILKYKFLKTVDCIVTDKGLDGKDNLEIAVMRDGKPVNVGRVSALTGDGNRINVGDVVTVTTLYSTDAGRLFHPVKPRLRTDKLPEECTYDQVEVIRTNKKVLQ